MNTAPTDRPRPSQPLRRRWLLLGLALYWPALFVASHMPIPGMVRQAGVSDKTLHFTAYFILVFLFWGAVKPYEKVRWNRATVWWVLVVVVWYGAVDEWLQGYVRGRTVDIGDFYADLAAALTSLVLLSLFSFWSTFLLVSASAIFLITVCAKADLNELMPLANLAFHLGAYAFFTAQWVLFLARNRRGRHDPTDTLLRFVGPSGEASVASGWVRTLGMPFVLLTTVKLCATAWGKPVIWTEVVSAVLGIVAVLAIAGMRRRVGKW